MVYQVVLIAIVFFLLAFRFYGRFLAKRFNADDLSLTPACQINDGVDYVPAKANLLLGQHFSAIAAAGPMNTSIKPKNELIIVPTPRGSLITIDAND